VAESLLAGAGQRVGPRRLAQVLHTKGIDRELIDGALARARGDEFERAWALWLRRYGEPPADAAGRARQMRFLAGRGFGGEVIGRVMRQAIHPATHPPLSTDEPAPDT
jgi:regulatory protein